MKFESNPFKAKYRLCPDWVVSKNDGQEHFINEHQLVKLFKVDPALCFHSQKLIHYGHLIHLRPQYDGNYTLPTT